MDDMEEPALEKGRWDRELIDDVIEVILVEL